MLSACQAFLPGEALNVGAGRARAVELQHRLADLKPMAIAYASGPSSGLISYAPQGAIDALNLGNGVSEGATYNHRLQPELIEVEKGATGLLDLEYVYDKSSGCNGTSTCNNGNVLSQEITVGAWSTSQYYQYDDVNRLALAAEEPTSPSSLECPDEGSSWCEEFDYDGRGNQWLSAASFSLSQLTPTSSDWFGDDNRLERPGYPNDFDYDSAGNQTRMGSSITQLTYDAENRQTQSTAVPRKGTST